MNTGARSEVTVFPLTPVLEAGASRKSLTEAGFVSSIWKVMVLLLPDAATLLGLLAQDAVAVTLNVPLRIGLPEESRKSWNGKLKVPSDWIDEAGRVKVLVVVLVPFGALVQTSVTVTRVPIGVVPVNTGAVLLVTGTPLTRLTPGSARVGGDGGDVGGGTTMSVAWRSKVSVTGLLRAPAASVV